MPNSKQKVRDRDYFGEYQKKSCYSVEQWEKIISNEAFVSPTELSILKEIFLSANHAASLSQLAFRHKKDASYFISKMNQLASNIGRPNGYSIDVDLDGNEYWWYLLFWGKNTKLAGLEWKLIPELAEAIEYTYPELEDQYNTYMAEIERSEQIRYTKEDSVWIASTLLLFEKVYLENPTDIYDLLLMQYEISQRSQKIYGQDVDIAVITDNCNADSSRCIFPYLRDIDKYWRVCYPGEIEDAVLRPEKIDYNAYVPSKFGFMKLKELCNFLETDYCRLTDPNYVEIDESNPFYKIISFLRTNGGRRYMDLTAPTEEDIERFLKQKEQGKEALNEFHSLGKILTGQYPAFIQTEQASWLEQDNTTIKRCWIDSYELKEMKGFGPAFSILCAQKEEQKGKIIFSVILNFPVESPELTETILEKCGNLTVLTSANFQVEKSIRMDSLYSSAFGNSILAYVSYDEQLVLEETYQDMIIRFETAIQILASYFLDICESVYAPFQNKETEINEPDNISAKESETESSQSAAITVAEALIPSCSQRERYPVSQHTDRKDTTFNLYPKNILIHGPSNTGQMEYAIRIAVGIIEGTEENLILKEPYKNITDRFKKHREDGRILFTADAGVEYEDWMESKRGEERFTRFSNHAGEGRYVCIVQDLDGYMLKQSMKDASYLIHSKKREGQPEEQSVHLHYSMESFSIPSNLYFIGTTCKKSELLSGDSILNDFHRKYTFYDSSHLDNILVDNIEIRKIIDTMNLRLTYLIGSSYQIGQEFFESLVQDRSFETFSTIMYERVLPYLIYSFEDCCYDNPYKGIHLVFGDFKKTNEAYQFIKKEHLCAADFFGNNTNMKDKDIYTIQKKAFFEPNSYLEI